MKEFIEIPFGAKDSELGGWEYNIPEGYTASIENGKIVVKKEKGMDEKIREALIDFFSDGAKRNYSTFGVDDKDILAWVEKQGTPAKLSEEEQNRFAKGVLKSCALSFINYLDTHKYESKMCVSNGECEDIENAFHNAMWDRLHRYYCKYIEKQGEQKSTNDTDEEIVEAVKDTSVLDLVESKFKVGDWVVIKQ